jgi:uncharacterized membrane protein YphA (DoxX/SURF4 family)
MLATFFFLALHMQPVLGYTAMENGLTFLPISVAVILAAALASQLVNRFGFLSSTGRIGVEFPLALIAGLLAILLACPGRLSLDYLLGVERDAVEGRESRRN